MVPSPINPIIEAYAVACAAGCALELKLRLLAENQPATRPLAHARDLGDVEEAIIAARKPDRESTGGPK